MRAATLLFYAFASFCLGYLALVAGAGTFMVNLGFPEWTLPGFMLFVVTVFLALAVVYALPVREDRDE